MLLFFLPLPSFLPATPVPTGDIRAHAYRQPVMAVSAQGLMRLAQW